MEYFSLLYTEFIYFHHTPLNGRSQANKSFYNESVEALLIIRVETITVSLLSLATD